MRYSASEKFEIIELVQQSSLSIPRTLAPIGIPRSTFYDWYSRYQEGGIEALADGKPRPRRASRGSDPPPGVIFHSVPFRECVPMTAVGPSASFPSPRRVRFAAQSRPNREVGRAD